MESHDEDEVLVPAEVELFKMAEAHPADEGNADAELKKNGGEGEKS